ncbi:hypothetical protein BDA96_01G400000 [Sorghum bicolor]|uniref:Uncharacterized protein n=2 Tax=Sorghum bicolor TaxID=4558 RepID=A0A921V1F2_SORBI|nr:hypothetical protein BDA96_01G400000 [Sorghum bicolor]OQU92613.1 hypothetical protein SORBI_3001G376150 [Sorghum bicolor]
MDIASQSNSLHPQARLDPIVSVLALIPVFVSLEGCECGRATRGAPPTLRAARGRVAVVLHDLIHCHGATRSDRCCELTLVCAGSSWWAQRGSPLRYGFRIYFLSTFTKNVLQNKELTL